jgi:hypothetical protein
LSNFQETFKHFLLIIFRNFICLIFEIDPGKSTLLDIILS